MKRFEFFFETSFRIYLALPCKHHVPAPDLHPAQKDGPMFFHACPAVMARYSEHVSAGVSVRCSSNHTMPARSWLIGRFTNVDMQQAHKLQEVGQNTSVCSHSRISQGAESAFRQRSSPESFAPAETRNRYFAFLVELIFCTGT